MHKKIRDIVIGDKVKVYDTDKQAFSFSKVSKIWEHASDHYYILNGKTKVTEMHPYYVEGEWVRVKDLKKGDKLFNKSGHTVPIKSLKRVEESIAVYNMEVDGQHNYFANDILVHNGKGGSYRGKDKSGGSDVGASRTAINTAADTFNATIPAAVGDSLAGQFEAARSFKDAVGLTSSSIDGTEGGNTGFQKVLIDSLADNAKNLLTTQQDTRSAKTSTLKSAGETFRNTQKTVNKAKESSGMVSSNERMQMDADVAVGKSGSDAQADAKDAMEKANENKTFEDDKAQQDLKDAVAQAGIDMENAMGDQVNSVVDKLNKQTIAMNDAYKGVTGLKGHQKENASSRVKMGGGAKDKTTPTGPAITQTKYVADTSSLLDPGAGAMAVTSSYNLKGTTGVQDATNALSTKYGMGNFAGTTMTSDADDNATGETVGASDITGLGTDTAGSDATAQIDPMASIQKVWSGAAGDAKLQQVMGPGNMDNVSGDDQYIVPRCFAGDTIILTEES